ncbi:hypothetical protein [Desulfurococcus amylolyticus]|uniref:hypothetical protein n=1 Tax=Desulfurococcus amylolyticus TaxID=94694 RepID=UPI0023F051E6|nr:hypothetical protein [Desulfurococcus amylolyticus]
MSATQLDVNTVREILQRLAVAVCDVSYYADIYVSNQSRYKLDQYKTARNLFYKAAKEFGETLLRHGADPFAQLGDLCLDAVYAVTDLTHLASKVFDIALDQKNQSLLRIAADMYLEARDATVFLVKHCDLAEEAGEE